MSDNVTVFDVDYTGVTGIKCKGTGNGTLTYIRPQGTKSISANGTGIDVAAYATVDVSVSGGGGLDLPTFTVTNGVTTCNKSYSECRALSDSNAYAVVPNNNIAFVGQRYVFDSSQLVYVFFQNGVPAMGLTYSSDGTIELLDDAPSATTATFIENGTYETGVEDGVVWNKVIVNVPSGSANLQSKSVSYTPSETAQSETVSPDSGYDGLSSVAVSVGAVASDYVGSGITRRSGSDLTASGATVTVPGGYYSTQATKAVSSGSEGTPTATKGTVSNHAISVTPSVTNTAGYISGGTKTGTAVSVTASELVSGTLSITSSGTKDVTNYASASVGAGSVNAPTATKGTVSNNTVSVTPSVSFGAGYIEGGSSTGTAVSVSASELVDGTYTINSAGTKDVTNYASASVPAGTEGTPTATKGTVSNHAISVTPSVTNSAGFITGATKTGTAVTVSASELVSGSETKTANGTYDVTNLASLVVAVPIVTYYTSSSNPTSSQGSNGDIWLVTS